MAMPAIAPGAKFDVGVDVGVDVVVIDVVAIDVVAIDMVVLDVVVIDVERGIVVDMEVVGIAMIPR
jgi:hypothetical protein